MTALAAPAPPPAKYVTSSQAVDYVGCTRDILYAAAAAGNWDKIPLPENSGTLWRMRDVEAFRKERQAAVAQREAQRPQDRSSESGAKALAFSIRNYWHKRGFSEADAWAERTDDGFNPLLRCASYWVVRSNLIDGWPPGRRGE